MSAKLDLLQSLGQGVKTAEFFAVATDICRWLIGRWKILSLLNDKMN